MTAKGDITDAQLKESFDKIDTDKSGYVNTAELKALFMDCGLDAKEAEETANVSKMKFEHEHNN